MQRNGIISRYWFKAAGVRALKTIAQTMVATMSTASIISEVDWRVVCSASILAGFLSILTSIGGLPEVDEHTGKPKQPPA